MTRNCASLRLAILAAGAITLIWPAAVTATTIAGIYTDQITTTCGTSVESCTANLKVIPAGKVLILTRVSCHISFASTAKVSGLMVFRSTTASTFDFQYLAPLNFISSLNGRSHYLVSGDALLALKAGDHPAVKVSFWDPTASPQMACSVHGTLKAA